jgi:hypothetical protein
MFVENAGMITKGFTIVQNEKKKWPNASSAERIDNLFGMADLLLITNGVESALYCRLMEIQMWINFISGRRSVYSAFSQFLTILNSNKKKYELSLR